MVGEVNRESLPRPQGVGVAAHAQLVAQRTLGCASGSVHRSVHAGLLTPPTEPPWGFGHDAVVWGGSEEAVAVVVVVTVLAVLVVVVVAVTAVLAVVVVELESAEEQQTWRLGSVRCQKWAGLGSRAAQQPLHEEQHTGVRAGR